MIHKHLCHAMWKLSLLPNSNSWNLLYANYMSKSIKNKYRPHEVHSLLLIFISEIFYSRTIYSLYDHFEGFSISHLADLDSNLVDRSVWHEWQGLMMNGIAIHRKFIGNSWVSICEKMWIQNNRLVLNSVPYPPSHGKKPLWNRKTIDIWVVWGLTTQLC